MMRPSIPKIPRIIAAASSSSSSFSTAGGRGRGFLPKLRSHTSMKVGGGRDYLERKPRPHTSTKVENEAKFDWDIFGPTKIVSQLRESVSDKLPTSREEVLELLREVIEKVNKSLFMSNTRIKSEEEWKEIIEETLNAVTTMRKTEEMTKMAKRVSTKIIEAEEQGQTPGAETLLADESIKALFQTDWLFEDKREFENEFINMHIWCIMYINQQLEIWPQVLWMRTIQHVALCIHPWETDYKKDCLDTDYTNIFGNRQPTKVVSQLRESISDKLPTSRKEVLELLREVLEKLNKPFWMAGRRIRMLNKRWRIKSEEEEWRIRSEEVWEEAIEETVNAITIVRETKEMTKLAKRISTEMKKKTISAETGDTLVDETKKVHSQSNSCWVFDDEREFMNEFWDMYIWCRLYMRKWQYKK